jgi:hypothetical protein
LIFLLEKATLRPIQSGWIERTVSMSDKEKMVDATPKPEETRQKKDVLTADDLDRVSGGGEPPTHKHAEQ